MFIVANGVSSLRSAGLLSRLAHALSSDDAHAVQQAVNFTGRDPLYAVPTTRTMDSVLRSFATTGARRLAVVDASDDMKRVVGVISQVRFSLHGTTRVVVVVVVVEH